MSIETTSKTPTTEVQSKPRSTSTDRPVFGRPKSDGLVDFIPAARIEELIKRPPADAAEVQAVLDKSMALERLTLEEMAVLISATDRDVQEQMFEAARQLKREVYGNRIVLFAPLYLGNKCINSCKYCGFRHDNDKVVRRTLTDDEIRAEVRALISKGHKRIVIDYGEHPDYSAEQIAHAVNIIYSTKDPERPGAEIRRINVNCAPLTVEGYRLVKQAGIGTYQIFQETYHRPTYTEMHPRGPKSDFLWRLYGQDRAMEAGCDDVGLGALFGLYDWRFELLGLLAHAIHLEETYGVGPHTFSFPRLKEINNPAFEPKYAVSDDDFARVIAILRLSVPYVGMILTAREPAELRRRLIEFGVSQIDGGTHIEIGGYSEEHGDQDLSREQFRIGDERSLEEVIAELIEMGEVPSFCTACYRLGRTGTHFMDLAKPGDIKHRCAPNALSTLLEYLIDYASPKTREAGERLIARELEQLDEKDRAIATRLLARVREGKRDVFC
ncbi:MAG: [FeFe] hydrogenase H-cluster radical SAM maturase HydG [Thermoleophilia bacterium]|nr:[FeFe] hydrogenase H-cluster radical SAM maturase HydG [Thermoleophilia bacterium]